MFLGLTCRQALELGRDTAKSGLCRTGRPRSSGGDCGDQQGGVRFRRGRRTILRNEANKFFAINLAVRDAVARLIADVYAGKVHPRIAAGLAPLMNLQLRAIETADLELRVAKLERPLAQAEDKLNRVAALGSDVIQLRKPPRQA